MCAIFRAFCAAVILTMPIVGRAQGNIIPPSGDTTGKTDGAAINAALSSNLSAELACNAQYYTNVTIQVPGGASFVGCGYSSKISGVGNITGGIIQLLEPSLDQWAAQLVSDFQITGGTATEAILAGGPTGVGPWVGVHMSNIWVTGGTYTNVFWFSYFFNNQADNLIAGQVLGSTTTVSAACFHFDGAVNADVFSNLSATCGAPYGFYMENDNEPGNASTGNTFNTLNAEGSPTGLYVGNGFGNDVFNGFYSESVLHPIVLGNVSASDACYSLTFNSPVIGGPASLNANQVALVDVDLCRSVTFVAPQFNIYGIAHSAPLTFSGGGCIAEPTAIAIPNPSGVIKVVTLTFPGGGCTSAPTVAVGGAGSGATVTATESGGVVTALTLGSGGTGYTLASIVPVIYNSPLKVTIINPFCEDGVTGASPCWPWMVRASGGSEGIRILGDTAIINGVSVPADLEPTGTGNQHYLKYLDSSGAAHLLSVVPQVYP